MPSSVPAGPELTGEDPFAGTAYRSVRRLAAGGMGEVFVVSHRELGREFVAKVLHLRYAKDERLIDRVRIEAQTLGRLDHPNIVSVSGFGTAKDGRPFIVMELLYGRTLGAELEARGKLPLPEALHYVRELLGALGAAHALGIVHRDIKPENLFLAERPDGTRTLKVLDFGIVRVLPGFDGSPQPLALPTATGLVVGTPRYVSPEGALGAKVDHRADLYAAGLVLYVSVAGRGPFDHLRKEGELLNAHASTRPAAPSTVAGLALPQALDLAVLHSLEKRPEGRFQSAEEFMTALDQIGAALRTGEPLAIVEPDPYPAPDSLTVAPAIDPSTSGLRRVPQPPNQKRFLLLFVLIAAVTSVIVSQVVRAILVWSAR